MILRLPTPERRAGPSLHLEGEPGRLEYSFVLSHGRGGGSSGGQALRSPEVSHRGGLLLSCLSNENQGRSQVPENSEFLRVNKSMFQWQ